MSARCLTCDGLGEWTEVIATGRSVTIRCPDCHGVGQTRTVLSMGRATEPTRQQIARSCAAQLGYSPAQPNGYDDSNLLAEICDQNDMSREEACRLVNDVRDGSALVWKLEAYDAAEQAVKARLIDDTLDEDGLIPLSRYALAAE